MTALLSLFIVMGSANSWAVFLSKSKGFPFAKDRQKKKTKTFVCDHLFDHKDQAQQSQPSKGIVSASPTVPHMPDTLLCFHQSWLREAI